MFVRLLIAIALIGFIWALMAHYRKQKPAVKKKLGLQYAVIGLAGVVLILAVTGKLHWISALIAGTAAAVVRFLPLVARFFPVAAHLYQQKKSSQTSSGNKSTVQSDYLKVVLDHDSENISGEVIAGQYAGKNFDQLSKKQLRELLDFYNQNDGDSYQLLYAYLQRQHPDEDWDSSQHREQSQQSGSLTSMNRKEALEILGLEEDASKEDINLAHKKLMQRLHPDRGGSTYLAAKVNQAKDLLIK